MPTANADVFENKGRPPHGTGGCGGTTLVILICLIPGVSKRCRAEPWECVADLVGADASCSGEQAGAHERPHGEPGQPDSEGSSHCPTVSERVGGSRSPCPASRSRSHRSASAGGRHHHRHVRRPERPRSRKPAPKRGREIGCCYACRDPAAGDSCCSISTGSRREGRRAPDRRVDERSPVQFCA